MVTNVDLSKVVGSKVHDRSIRVMDKAECKRLYGSQKKVKMVKGVVVNVDLQITKKRRKNYMLFMTAKILMEVSRGPGYILSMWFQLHL